jgi:photosystem II stability/assembly factor-like uncharacterized protein
MDANRKLSWDDDNMSLDVGAPGSVELALRVAAQRYYESAGELLEVGQDAGKVWERIAKELERAAVRIEQICNQA